MRVDFGDFSDFVTEGGISTEAVTIHEMTFGHPVATQTNWEVSWPVDAAAEIGALRAAVVAVLQKLQHSTKIVPMSTLGIPGFRLRMPVSVLIEEDDYHVVASLPDVSLYGAGETVHEAISRLAEVCVNEFVELETDEANLGAGPLETLVRLRELLERPL